ncbi:hypothetical protein WJ07_21410 [Burkholderia vietnamiensis]|nr:hypothetical protein WJ01_01015 [Burkholderia vietnamiensis]KVF20006.1 hypothetical protein WJ07_21410 [Burkholderia vietnamiensis]
MVGGDRMLVQIGARHPYDMAAFGSIQRYPHQFIGLESSALANLVSDAFRRHREWLHAVPGAQRLRPHLSLPRHRLLHAWTDTMSLRNAHACLPFAGASAPPAFSTSIPCVMQLLLDTS